MLFQSCFLFSRKMFPVVCIFLIIHSSTSLLDVLRLVSISSTLNLGMFYVPRISRDDEIFERSSIFPDFFFFFSIDIFFVLKISMCSSHHPHSILFSHPFPLLPISLTFQHSPPARLQVQLLSTTYCHKPPGLFFF